jgi:hypothetical protein
MLAIDSVKKMILDKGLLSINGKLNRRCKNSNIELYDFVYNVTSFLPDTCGTYERLYCILNDITDITKCLNPACNNHTKFTQSKHYQKYCSRKCSVECADEIGKRARLKFAENHYKKMR